MKRNGPVPAGRKTRFVVVDDHPLLREGLVKLLSTQPDLECCGEADNVADAKRLAVEHKPGLMLLDLRLKSGDSLDLIKTLKVESPGLKILVISQHDEMLFAERALRAGARGYIMKHEGGSKVVRAIRVVLGGEIYVSDGVSRRVLAGLSAAGHRALHSPIEQLSDREFEVFQLLGEGLPTQQIGRRLNLSSKTVETHRMNIKVKLGFKSSCELIAHAARWIESETNRGKPDPPKRGAASLEKS